jgi:hypothetical protein
MKGSLYPFVGMANTSQYLKADESFEAFVQGVRLGRSLRPSCCIPAGLIGPEAEVLWSSEILPDLANAMGVFRISFHLVCMRVSPSI